MERILPLHVQDHLTQKSTKYIHNFKHIVITKYKYVKLHVLINWFNCNDLSLLFKASTCFLPSFFNSSKKVMKNVIFSLLILSVINIRL